MTPTIKSRTLNFPTPPVKSFSSLSMPNDLVADGRNYYTEIFFVDYRAAAYGSGALFNIVSFVTNPFGLSGTSGSSFGGIRLPIPRKINDTLVLNWETNSAMSILGGAAGAAAGLSPALSQAIGQGGALGLALAGKAINPLLFLTFNHQNFREFTFQWELAPRTRRESQTIRNIVEAFKGASLPTKGIIMDYPLIAMVNMSPNNLNGHAVFQPMAITAVSANYTPNPTPSFFENTGAPTVVTLTVAFKEIKLWYRGATGTPQS